MHPTDIPNLISFWDFQESAGETRVAVGPYSYVLREAGGEVARADEGVFGPFSAHFGTGSYLTIPRRESPALNISGPGAQVSIVAWVKRAEGYPGCQAVAGVWNEHGQRQYCLFLNLHIWDSAEQVCAHVSNTGGPTPGYKYCMDAAIGTTPVSFGEWHCIAMTYDGQYAKAYLDGKLDVRGDRNPFYFPGGLYDGGENGADFTVGAVFRPDQVLEDLTEIGSRAGNPFVGLLGGLAVYNRGLSDDEVMTLARLPKSAG